MKFFVLGAFLISSLSALASSSVLDSVSEKVCRNKKIDYQNDIATCSAKDAKSILAGKVSVSLDDEEVAMLDFIPMGPIELGIIPDADTSVIYSYIRYLTDQKGAAVGILTIDGYTNSEMGIRGRVDTRYNFRGEVVSIELK
jgi:hypothetical protein